MPDIWTGIPDPTWVLGDFLGRGGKKKKKILSGKTGGIIRFRLNRLQFFGTEPWSEPLRTDSFEPFNSTSQEGARRVRRGWKEGANEKEKKKIKRKKKTYSPFFAEG